MRRSAKSRGAYFVEAEPKLAFVIRIRGINTMDPKSRSILRLLRLRQVHNGTFVRLNKASINMLRKVEPYVTYGFPNLRSVRELIYKRGFGTSSAKQRIALRDNEGIHKSLGKHGIHCVEDLIHEIYTVGPRFKQANRFLWPFQLNSPKGGFRKITKQYNAGGDAGPRDNQINRLIRAMN